MLSNKGVADEKSKDEFETGSEKLSTTSPAQAVSRVNTEAPALAASSPQDADSGHVSRQVERYEERQAAKQATANAEAAKPDTMAWYFEHVLAPLQAGTYYVVSHTKGRGHWRDEVAHSTIESLDIAQKRNADPAVIGVYAAQGLMRPGESKRSAEQAVVLNALWLECDAKDFGIADQPLEDQYRHLITELDKLCAAVGLPRPSVLIGSGGGTHAFWLLDKPIPKEHWQPHADALSAAAIAHSFPADLQCTTDAARVLRLPETENRKPEYGAPRPVVIIYPGDKSAPVRYSVDELSAVLAKYSNVSKPKLRVVGGTDYLEDASLFPPRALTGPVEELGRGIQLNVAEIRSAIMAISPSEFDTEDKWMNNAARPLAYTARLFPEHKEELWAILDEASKRPGAGKYDVAENRIRFERYIDEAFDRQKARTIGTIFALAKKHDWKGLPPPAELIAAAAQGDQALGAQAPSQLITTGFGPAQPAAPSPSFVDPYSEFVGPQLPAGILPPVLADFVEAQHRAMGADPAALAMAALAAAAGAINAQTQIQMGSGWNEKPIIWVALVGDPSSMKSPTIDKVTEPLIKIDHNRDTIWRTQYGLWQQAKNAAKTTGLNPGPQPAKPARCVLQDATPEKTAELLARDPAGALMVHDELAGWIAGFERYGSGPSARALFLSSWNGKPFLKDRVGQGTRDEHAEIRVENLGLGLLGGIQPDRLAAIRDLTSDGLLQRFLLVLMQRPERSDEKHPVSTAEAEYGKLIQALNAALPFTFTFSTSAEDVRQRVLDRLFELEQGGGFSNSVIGAVGKLKGYFARLALVLHVVGEHSAILRGQGTGVAQQVSQATAEAAEKLIFEFLLPHMLGLYDVIADGGQDRETIRAVADFILASSGDRLRPCDFTKRVWNLRGQPTNKVADWASRFIALGWLRAEDEKAITPKARIVEPGLRAHFEAHCQRAHAARAKKHAILKSLGRQA